MTGAMHTFTIDKQAATVLHHIALADCVPRPWKNGGGSTRELLAWPTADRWVLRISVATIDRDGPFSAFDGIERWLAVIDGPGVELHWPCAADGTARIERLRAGDAPIAFDGGDPPAARMAGGPTTDFNLMVRRQAGRATLVAARPGLPAPGAPGAAGWRGVYVNRAAWLHGPTQAPLQLRAGTLAFAAPATLAAADPAAAMRALAVAPEASSTTTDAWVLEPVVETGSAGARAGSSARASTEPDRPLGWWIGLEASATR